MAVWSLGAKCGFRQPNKAASFMTESFVQQRLGPRLVARPAATGSLIDGGKFAISGLQLLVNDEEIVVPVMGEFLLGHGQPGLNYLGALRPAAAQAALEFRQGRRQNEAQ